MILGPYRILKRLAIGGMGEIFLGRQIGVAGFDRPVIIKRLLPDLAEDATAIEQFLDEARIAATLNHPNIVAIYEVAEWRGMQFIAMEYIEGETIAAIMRALVKQRGSVPFAVAARITHDAALALDHAHRACGADGTPLRIIHRDVSPQNIMVRRDGVTKVVDFGIAKVADRSGRTSSGVLKGKLRYMAPEQLREQPLDHRIDQFALGVTFWEMCTGRRLFKKDVSISARLNATRVPPPVSVRRDVPRELDRIVTRMLAADRDVRFSSCLDVADALDVYLSTPAGRTDLREVAALVERTVGDRIAERTRVLRSGEPCDDDLSELAILAEDESPPKPEALAAPEALSGAPNDKTAPLHPYASESVANAGVLTTRRPVGMLLAGLFFVVGVALAVVLLVRAPRAPQPIVVVQHELPSGKAPDAGVVTLARAEPKRRASLDLRLTRAFARRRKSVERCFERFGGADAVDVSVRFEVDTGGRVAAAAILPDGVARSEVGACLLEVARSTKFPRQPKPVTFRIPLRIAR